MQVKNLNPIKRVALAGMACAVIYAFVLHASAGPGGANATLVAGLIFSGLGFFLPMAFLCILVILHLVGAATVGEKLRLSGLIDKDDPGFSVLCAVFSVPIFAYSMFYVVSRM